MLCREAMDCRRQLVLSILVFSVVISLTFYGYLSVNRNSVSHFRQQIGNETTRIASEKKEGTLWEIWPTDNSETRDDRISEQNRFMSSLNESGRLKVTAIKVIYFMSHANYGDPPPEGQQLFLTHRCPVQACRISRREADARMADAVLMQDFQTSMLGYLLPRRTSQVWIMSGWESPPLNNRMNMFDAHGLRNLVNWTITYRRDSTISQPYGKFETFPNFTKLDDYHVANGTNYAAGKTKKVAWLVSNCDFGTHSGRKEYADELSKHIQADIYGRCGKIQCPKHQMAECLRMVRTDYKFYLAFENNCCKDYITEKFFHNALQNNVLPIVLGASPDDYKALAPPGSFIHVDDFTDPKQLADYLHILDKNDTLYNEYFRWKVTGRFANTRYLCRLCALLHAKDIMNYVHWYPDFYQWWEQDACRKNPPAGKWQSWRNTITEKQG